MPKLPAFPPVKTRLAAEIGADKAEVFYHHSLQCLEELALDVLRKSKGGLVPYWAVGDQDGLDHPLWQNLDRLWTGEGDLGERLNHVYATLLQQHNHVILIGTDSPQLQSDVLLTAHKHLTTKQGPVIGAADDGGYYLFGGYVPLPRDVWTSVPYSVATTCKIFAEKLAPYGTTRFLESTFDIDTYDDLIKLQACGASMSGQAQKSLLKWLDQHPVNPRL